MASLSQSAPPERAEIHLQLERLIGSSHMRHSRRCQALLRYVVEAWLEGSLDRIRERRIGLEVFGREEGYDTAQDSVVRTTAAEVRKRLAQYYVEPGHESELRIELPPGSYVPEFRRPLVLEATASASSRAVAVRPFPWTWALPAALLIAVVALVSWRWLNRPSDLDLFWKPLLDDPAPAVICIEQPLRVFRFTGPKADEWNDVMTGNSEEARQQRENGTVPLSELRVSGENYFTYGDLMASSSLIEMLARRHKPLQVQGDRITSYSDLRGRPAILLGQFNNKWTNGLLGGLRFHLDKDPVQRLYLVRDRQQGDNIIASYPRASRAEEYAVVSRILDPSTEKTVVAVEGTTYRGSMVAADFLIHEAYLHEAVNGAPADWARKNLQFVLHATLVSGVPGPPKLVAKHVW